MNLARRGITLLLRSRRINDAVLALARARGRSLVLVYHRVAPPSSPPGKDLVPTVPHDVFRAHLQLLAEVADLVSLDELLNRCGSSPRGGERPGHVRVALTFDDDLVSHATDVLPLLRRYGTPGAFFLSGRSLAGLGAYWFQRLEALLRQKGPEQVAACLGLPGASLEVVMRACERDRDMRRRLAEATLDDPEPRVLQRDHIAALAGAGMTIGFHTIHHERLPGLCGTQLQSAIAAGRGRLASAAGCGVRFFAYPHGTCDARCARAVRLAGFEAAFTGRPQAMPARHDRYTIGRWEPGPLSLDDLLVTLAVRLHRPVSSSATAGTAGRN